MAGQNDRIGFDCDIEAGRINLMLEPDGEPENCLQVNVDVANIMVGNGDEN